MTWAKASPVLIIAIIFDAVRCFFEMFWFFGPALAGVGCTFGVNGWIGTTLVTVGGKLVAVGCAALAGVLGFYGSGAIEAFGVVMALATGLIGWLTVGLILIITNARIFKENEGHALWFIVSLAISEVPIVGSLPGLTVIAVKMYSTQIKKDKAALKKYQKEREELQNQDRNQKIAEFMQERTNEPEPGEIY